MCRITKGLFFFIVLVVFASCRVFKDKYSDTDCDKINQAVLAFIHDWETQELDNRMRMLYIIDSTATNEFIKKNKFVNGYVRYHLDSVAFKSIDYERYHRLDDIVANKNVNIMLVDLEKLMLESDIWRYHYFFKFSNFLPTGNKNEYYMLAYQDNIGAEELGALFKIAFNKKCELSRFEIVDSFLRLY